MEEVKEYEEAKEYLENEINRYSKGVIQLEFHRRRIDSLVYRIRKQLIIKKKMLAYVSNDLRYVIETHQREFIEDLDEIERIKNRITKIRQEKQVCISRTEDLRSKEKILNQLAKDSNSIEYQLMEWQNSYEELANGSHTKCLHSLLSFSLTWPVIHAFISEDLKRLKEDLAWAKFCGKRKEDQTIHSTYHIVKEINIELMAYVAEKVKMSKGILADLADSTANFRYIIWSAFKNHHETKKSCKKLFEEWKLKDLICKEKIRALVELMNLIEEYRLNQERILKNAAAIAIPANLMEPSIACQVHQKETQVGQSSYTVHTIALNKYNEEEVKKAANEMKKKFQKWLTRNQYYLTPAIQVVSEKEVEETMLLMKEKAAVQLSAIELVAKILDMLRSDLETTEKLQGMSTVRVEEDEELNECNIHSVLDYEQIINIWQKKMRSHIQSMFTSSIPTSFNPITLASTSASFNTTVRNNMLHGILEESELELREKSQRRTEDLEFMLNQWSRDEEAEEERWFMEFHSKPRRSSMDFDAKRFSFFKNHSSNSAAATILAAHHHEAAISVGRDPSNSAAGGANNKKAYGSANYGALNLPPIQQDRLSEVGFPDKITIPSLFNPHRSASNDNYLMPLMDSITPRNRSYFVEVPIKTQQNQQTGAVVTSPRRYSIVLDDQTVNFQTTMEAVIDSKLYLIYFEWMSAFRVFQVKMKGMTSSFATANIFETSNITSQELTSTSSVPVSKRWNALRLVVGFAELAIYKNILLASESNLYTYISSGNGAAEDKGVVYTMNINPEIIHSLTEIPLAYCIQIVLADPIKFCQQVVYNLRLEAIQPIFLPIIVDRVASHRRRAINSSVDSSTWTLSDVLGFDLDRIIKKDIRSRTESEESMTSTDETIVSGPDIYVAESSIPASNSTYGNTPASSIDSLLRQAKTMPLDDSMKEKYSYLLQVLTLRYQGSKLYTCFSSCR